MSSRSRFSCTPDSSCPLNSYAGTLLLLPLSGCWWWWLIVLLTFSWVEVYTGSWETCFLDLVLLAFLQKLESILWDIERESFSCLTSTWSMPISSFRSCKASCWPSFICCRTSRWLSMSQAGHRKAASEDYISSNLVFERPAQQRCSHVRQEPSQKIASWPTRFPVDSRMISSQIWQV